MQFQQSESNKWIAKDQTYSSRGLAVAQSSKPLMEPQRPSTRVISAKTVTSRAVSMATGDKASFLGSTGKKLSSRDIETILKLPSDQMENEKMGKIVETLMSQVKSLEGQKTADLSMLRFSTARTVSTQQTLESATRSRDSLVQQQSVLRQEILEIAKRLQSLEGFKELMKNSQDEDPRKANRFKGKLASTYGSISEAFIELGLKKRLDEKQKTDINDQEVAAAHEHLKSEQQRQIEEMNKFELLPLKKPKFVLLMDRIAGKREPNESAETKLLKKVIKNINLLYGKINQVDIEAQAHKSTFGEKRKDLHRTIEALDEDIKSKRKLINSLNLDEAFKLPSLASPKAAGFLEDNPVPFNFADVITDYKLLDVFSSASGPIHAKQK